MAKDGVRASVGQPADPDASPTEVTVGCDRCGDQTTYIYGQGDSTKPDGQGHVATFEEFIHWAIDDFDEEHICGSDLGDDFDADWDD